MLFVLGGRRGVGIPVGINSALRPFTFRESANLIRLVASAAWIATVALE